MSSEVISIYAFCQNHDIAKTSVLRWLNESGLPTDKGVDDELAQKILAKFKKSEVSVQGQNDGSAIAVTVTNDDEVEMITIDGPLGPLSVPRYQPPTYAPIEVISPVSYELLDVDHSARVAGMLQDIAAMQAQAAAEERQLRARMLEAAAQRGRDEAIAEHQVKEAAKKAVAQQLGNQSALGSGVSAAPKSAG